MEELSSDLSTLSYRKRSWDADQEKIRIIDGRDQFGPEHIAAISN